jgi:quercetin 2,3-dioxygenase
MTPYEIRPGAERGTLTLDWLQARFSFAFGSYRPENRMQFSALRVLNEDRVRPASGFAMHPHSDLEILIVPLVGTVAHEDSLGHNTIIGADDVLMMSAGSGIRHSQMNPSPELPDHHLQVWLLPLHPGRLPRVAWRTFAQAGRLDRWQAVVTPYGRDGTLGVDQDASMHRLRLSAGSSASYRVAAARSLYLHVATGAVEFSAQGVAPAERLTSGDAIAMASGRDFVLRGSPGQPAELMLLDLPPTPTGVAS